MTWCEREREQTQVSGASQVELASCPFLLAHHIAYRLLLKHHSFRKTLYAGRTFRIRKIMLLQCFKGAGLAGQVARQAHASEEGKDAERRSMPRLRKRYKRGRKRSKT